MKLAAAVIGVVNLLVLASVAVGGGSFVPFAIVAVLLNIAACLAVIRSLRSIAVRVGAVLVGLLDVGMVIDEIVVMSTVRYPNATAAAVWSLYGLVNASVCAGLLMSTFHRQPSKA